MKIKAITMGILLFVLIFGGIGATMAVDLWSTTSDKTPAKITSGESAGSYNPADIRGSYTFQQVADLFEIELQVLYTAFNIPAETLGEDIQTKDLETLFADSGAEIGNESVQIFVALYKNLPIDLDETLLPEQAVTLILEENGALTAQQKEYLTTHSVNLSSVTVTVPAETKESTTEETENVVNGSATFQKVMDAGITQEQIEKIINDTMPPTNQTVKDYCVEKGLSFSDIKAQLNALIEE